MFRKLMATAPVWTTVPLRLATGFIFITFGAQKVFGVLGGPGLRNWMAYEKSAVGLRPAWLWLGAAAFCELIGGLLVLFGLLTRLGALCLVPVMLVAIYGTVVAAGGLLPSISKIGFPLACLAMAFALAISGGGRLSVDALASRGKRR